RCYSHSFPTRRSSQLWCAKIRSQGSKGSVLSSFSFSLVTPSPSQSDFFQADEGEQFWCAKIRSQGSKGSVLSFFSFSLVTPSPSQSALVSVKHGGASGLTPSRFKANCFPLAIMELPTRKGSMSIDAALPYEEASPKTKNIIRNKIRPTVRPLISMKVIFPINDSLVSTDHHGKLGIHDCKSWGKSKSRRKIILKNRYSYGFKATYCRYSFNNHYTRPSTFIRGL